MSRHVPSAGGGRRDLYAEITAAVLADLETGVFPWAQPWSSSADDGRPYNAASARPYSGINILLFWMACRRRGFPTAGFLTFRQALALGGHVRCGEKGFRGVFAEQRVLAPERRAAEAEERPPQPVWFLKPFTVFNLAQCDGLPAAMSPPERPLAAGLIAPRAAALIAATGADLRLGGGMAFYDPDADFVQVPHPHAFAEPINWHRTVFHELGHWTGHGSRLGRDQSGAFGSAAYAREELVAEMTGAFVCAALSIRPTVRHADYLARWLQILRDDPRAIVRAASAASRAADLLLAFGPRQAVATPEALS